MGKAPDAVRFFSDTSPQQAHHVRSKMYKSKAVHGAVKMRNKCRVGVHP